MKENKEENLNGIKADVRRSAFQECLPDKHKQRDNKFGVTWCVKCGRLFTKPCGKPLLESDKVALSKGAVMLSLPLFRQLFDELINAGRDMRDRDRLGLYYLPEDEYFENVVKRYSNNGNGA